MSSDEEQREGTDEDGSAEQRRDGDVRAQDVEVADLRAREGVRADDRYDGEPDGADRRHDRREDRARERGDRQPRRSAFTSPHQSPHRSQPPEQRDHREPARGGGPADLVTVVGDEVRDLASGVSGLRWVSRQYRRDRDEHDEQDSPERAPSLTVEVL